MRRHVTVKIFFLVLLLIVCSVSFPNFSLAQKVITLNYSNFFPHRTSTAYLPSSGARKLKKGPIKGLRSPIFQEAR